MGLGGRQSIAHEWGRLGGGYRDGANALPYSSQGSLTLGIIFEGQGNVLRVFRGEVSLEPSVSAVISKHQRAAMRDVCAASDVFSAEDCVSALLAQSPQTLVCDAVLNQV
jgi:hypothetical protein